MDRRELLLLAGGSLSAGVAGCYEQVDERTDEMNNTDGSDSPDDSASSNGDESDSEESEQGSNESDSEGGDDEGTGDDDDGIGDGEDDEGGDSSPSEDGEDDSDETGQDDDSDDDGDRQQDDDEAGEDDDQDGQDDEDGDEEGDEAGEDDDQDGQDDEGGDEEDGEGDDGDEGDDDQQDGSEIPASFSSVATGGFFWTGEPDESTARDEDLEFLPPSELDEPIQVDGDVDASTGTWESTTVFFPTLPVAGGVEVDVEATDGFDGEIDLESGYLSLEGELRFDFVDVDATFRATVDSHTGESNQLSGKLEKEGDTVGALLVDNEFVVDDETGNNPIDDKMNLPSLTEGENWFEFELVLEIDYE